MSEWVSERGKGHSTHLKSNSSHLWYSIFKTELHCNQALKNFAIFWFLRIVRVYIFKQKTTLELAEVTRQASSSAISWRGAALSRTQNSFTASTIQRLTWVSPWKYFKQVLLGIEWHFLYPFFFVSGHPEFLLGRLQDKGIVKQVSDSIFRWKSIAISELFPHIPAHDTLAHSLGPTCLV